MTHVLLNIIYLNLIFYQYSNLEFKLLDQQKDHLLQIELLNEQLSVLKHLKDKPKEDVPVNLNESIITELKTELNEKKVLLTITIILMYSYKRIAIR